MEIFSLSKLSLRQKKEDGFTLIEILVAITVLSFFMVGAYTILSNSINTKDTITLEGQQISQVNRALNRIQRDFTQIYSPLYHSMPHKEKQNDQDASYDRPEQRDPLSYFRPSSRYPLQSARGRPVPVIENPDKSSLIFFSRSNRRKVMDAKESEYHWIRYALNANDGPDKKGDYILIRQSAANDIFSGEQSWDKVKQHLLLRNVQKLEFKFWEDKTKKFVDSINELGDNKYLLRALKINLVWIGPRGHEHKFSRIVRPLFPMFDPSVDKKLIDQERKKGEKDKSPKPDPL